MCILIRRLVYIFFSLPFTLLALNTDSSAVSEKPFSTTHYYYQHQFENSDSVNSIDTSLDNFQNYLPFNHLGNSGLAYNDLFYNSALTQKSGFNYYKNNYANYFFSPQKIKYYNTRTPYTDLFYVTGSKKEQIFRLIFSYNVKKNWNVTANFNRIRSDGFYTLQNTNDNSIAISSNFKSLNNRYYLLTAIIYNSAKNAENGGLANNLGTGTNLDSASRITIEKKVFFKQYFNLGKTIISTDSAHPNVIQPTSRFILTSSVENMKLKYLDY